MGASDRGAVRRGPSLYHTHPGWSTAGPAGKPGLRGLFLGRPMRDRHDADTVILFLEKVFLQRRTDDPLRGVELFDIALIRDLLQMGFPVTLPAHRSWSEVLSSQFKGRAPEFVWLRGWGIDFLNALWAARAVRGTEFDTLLLGNVGKSLMPGIRHLHQRHAFRQCVLIANREPSGSFARLMAGLPGHVLAVNGVIADQFKQAGHTHAHVDYGIVDADDFMPPDQDRAPGPVRFCVLGMLENAWKGAGTAVAAFRALPAETRARIELHLYGYRAPPVFEEEGIKAHPWVTADKVPDILRSMDVMLVPSHDEGVMRETFSQATVQGMLTGLPLVVSDRPVLLEKVDAGAGFVFRSVEELAVHMERFTRDLELRAACGRAARETALRRYVWSTGRFAEKYLALGGGPRE